MSEQDPPDDKRTAIVGSDWSVGLNSPTSIGQAKLLQVLGRALRQDYERLVREPLPDRLAAIVDRLDKGPGPKA
jgi:Anti-sigma factor NepR